MFSCIKKNKLTFLFKERVFVIGIQINIPKQGGPVGWEKLFHLKFSLDGGWRDVIWARGINR
jgi:hypothetical protein